MFTLGVVVDLPTDCILSSPFPAETDVLVAVLSHLTDVVVVNFVVVLKFPINSSWTTVKQIFEVRGPPYFDPEGEPNSLQFLWKRWIYVLGPLPSGRNVLLVVDY